MNPNPVRQRNVVPTKDKRRALKKRVLKLRWIGEEDRAERLADMLHRRWPDQTFVSPPETD